MDKKVFIAIAAVGVIVVMAGCVGGPPEVTPPPAITPTPTPTATPPAVTPTATPSPTPAPAVAAAVSCDMCHEREKTTNLEAHVKGGLLVNGKPGCFDYAGKPNLASGCHGVANATVHSVHPAKVGCVVCHGSRENPKIPAKGPGGTTCELCHDPHNPTKPSNGNLVTIHLERGKKCTVCHVGEISTIHGLK